MEPLFTEFSPGWDINVENLKSLRDDLQKVGTVEINFYRSRVPVLSSSTQVNHSQRADSSESNHVDILLHGIVIAQFFRRFWGFKGVLFEESIAVDVREPVEHILAAHRYYTRRTLPPPSSLTRYFYLIGSGVAFVKVFSSIYEIITAPYYLEGLPPDIVNTLPPEILELAASHHDSEIRAAIFWAITGATMFLTYVIYSRRSDSARK